jgi:hypothetical protein
MARWFISATTETISVAALSDGGVATRRRNGIPDHPGLPRTRARLNY